MPFKHVYAFLFLATVLSAFPGHAQTDLRAQVPKAAPTVTRAPGAPSPLLERPRYLIAFAGDSYASGEGAPQSPSPKWSDEGCHRSRENGRHAAANALAARLGPDSVAFVDVSCSGATIRNGLLGEYRGVAALRPSGPGNVAYRYEPQVEQIRTWMNQFPGRRLDALVMSVGGNDVGFAKVVTACMTPGNCNRDTGLANLIQRGDPRNPEVIGIRAMREALTRVDTAIRQRLNPRSIVLTGYPDPLRSRTGAYCNGYDEGYQILAIPGVENSPVWGAIAGASVKEISRTEAGWIYDNLLQPLNTERRRIAGELAWQFVEVEAFTKRNGYCAGNKRMFQTPKTSIQSQGDYNGTAHPDRNGFKVYQAVIEAALIKQLGIRQPMSAAPEFFDWHIQRKPATAPPPSTTSGPQIMRAEPRPIAVTEDTVDSLRDEPMAQGAEFFLTVVGKVGPVPGQITEVAFQHTTRGNPTAQSEDSAFQTSVLADPRPGYHTSRLDSARFGECSVVFVRWSTKSSAWYDASVTEVNRAPVKRLRLKCNGKAVEEI